MIFRLALPAALCALATFSQGCGNTSQPVPTPTANKAEQVRESSPSSTSYTATKSSASSAISSATSAAEQAASSSSPQELTHENAPKMPNAELPEDAPIPTSADGDSRSQAQEQEQVASSSALGQEVTSQGITGGWGRKLVGSCRLYFADESVRCREIYGNSQARFIKIFVKHCQTGANDYDGVWSEQACPVQMSEKERVGGCLAEDPDYSTIAYSYVDPSDALAKGLLPLVRSQCHGTYIPER